MLAPERAVDQLAHGLKLRSPGHKDESNICVISIGIAGQNVQKGAIILHRSDIADRLEPQFPCLINYVGVDGQKTWKMIAERHRALIAFDHRSAEHILNLLQSDQGRPYFFVLNDLQAT